MSLFDSRRHFFFVGHWLHTKPSKLISFNAKNKSETIDVKKGNDKMNSNKSIGSRCVYDFWYRKLYEHACGKAQKNPKSTAWCAPFRHFCDFLIYLL